jgi:hypothetical protein
MSMLEDHKNFLGRVVGDKRKKPWSIRSLDRIISRSFFMKRNVYLLGGDFIWQA